MESKNSQLAASQDALSAGEGEAGARALSAEESQAEVDALTEQVTNDEKYIAQAKASYATKMDEWKERKRLRTEEVASIQKAIEILSSDDAKDTMSSSFKSQGGFFLQNSNDQAAQARCSPKRRGNRAIEQLKEGARRHRDFRLAALAVSVSAEINGAAQAKTKGHFDVVVKSIDRMISDLNAEYDEDLKTKEDCEADRMSNTKTAKKAAQAMDDETALINRKKAFIADCQAEIKSIDATVKETKLQREEAQIARRKGKLEYEAAKAEDEQAINLMGAAVDVLNKFYTDNKLAMLQRLAQAPVVEAGAAPPPPPSTWSEPYGGAKGENNGVLSILSMIKSDVQKDIKLATAAEKESIKDYDTFMSSTKALLEELASNKASLEGEIGSAETAISESKTLRGEKKAVLTDTLKFLRTIAPSCDYIAVNFELRKQNREAEIDGLVGAKASLLGGTDLKPVSMLQHPCP